MAIFLCEKNAFAPTVLGKQKKRKLTIKEMFWKRKPKCPITIEDKEWIENHLNWLNENVVNLKNQPTILPTKKYFDWQFKGEEKDAEFILNKIGAYCNVNTEKINLDFYSEEAIELDRGTITQKEKGTGTAGLYFQRGNQFSILIEVQQLKKTNSLRDEAINNVPEMTRLFFLLARQNFLA